MRNQNNALFGALPIVAAAYGERIGVKVNIGGDMAYTDGKSINLPLIAPDAPQKDAIWGYLAHEGAHVRFTDFTVERRQGIHADLVNIIEDCRIEQLMIKQYPGTAQTLLDTCEYMLQQGYYQQVSADEHPARILSGYMLFWLQAYGVQQPPLERLAQQARSVFRQVFPAGAFTAMQSLLNDCVACKSTQEAADLADQILKMIEEEEQKEQQQQQQQSNGQPNAGQGDAGDEQQQDESQAAGNGNGGAGGDDQSDDQSDDTQAGNGQGDAEGEDAESQADAGGEAGDSQDESVAGGQSQVSGDEQDSESSQGQSSAAGGEGAASPSLSQQLSQAAGDDLLGDARDALKAEMQEAQEHSRNNRMQPMNIGSYPSMKEGYGWESLLQKSKLTSAGIRAQLNGLVQASQRKGVTNARQGKRVNANRLARVKAGETKVFQRPAPKTQPNTAVHILVDMSGSMAAPCADGRRRYEVASEAALSIALALESIQGVNPGVAYFGLDEAPVVNVLKHGKRVEARFFQAHAQGCTPMAEALWHAGYELGKCKEERKMVICITDGDPNCRDSVRDVLRLYDKVGVEAVAIGIGVDLVRTLFDQAIVIQDATELRSTLFELMRNCLVAA